MEDRIVASLRVIMLRAGIKRARAWSEEENSDVESSAKTDNLPGHFCVENISATKCAKSRKQSTKVDVKLHV
jgi:hypothetical protein